MVYLVQDTVTVPAGKTLTIAAGQILKFRSGSALASLSRERSLPRAPPARRSFSLPPTMTTCGAIRPITEINSRVSATGPA